ncbi:MAG TPA: oxygen-independent coproporphyrinogen III oxidase [Sediminibacterium sp.]|nr:oxygen-independent coproporphyrinogen III oxidase [Sediminibacterium sp.]
MNETGGLIRDLLEKYDRPKPRYTSYPTVPYWEDATLTPASWRKAVIDAFRQQSGELCLYIHLPFCENLCTFCACTKRITVNHGVEEPYLQAVLQEWALYKALLPGTPVIREIHLGGGTPTFFSPERLTRLIRGITRDAIVPDDHEFSVEVHPNFTTASHLAALAAVGFNRISLGVQDFDPVVQFAINRVQTFEQTAQVVSWAREHGFRSINVDLVYGLPHQTISSVQHTMGKIQTLMPDRIAFYSYAHVPWKSKVQRRYTESDLPAAADKWRMYHTGRNMLEAAGFYSIGMDHFALPDDQLFLAAEKGQLHRNFMGYTTTQSKLILALGASSISDSWTAFAQNEKEVERYESLVLEGKLPVVHGHLLNEEDLIIREKILDLMCRDTTDLQHPLLDSDFVQAAMEQLSSLREDGLLETEGTRIKVTARGKTFIRNICAALDARLWRKKPEQSSFSKAI